jgi:hypothetical protein
MQRLERRSASDNVVRAMAAVPRSQSRM